MDITKVPKKAAQNAGEISPKRLPERFTLLKLLTSDDSKPQMPGFLKELSKHKGPWSEYYNFFMKNMSGDIETMNEESRKFSEKLVKEVHDKYREEMS